MDSNIGNKIVPDNDIFIKVCTGETIQVIPLQKDYVRNYLVSVCEKNNIGHLDIEKILNNVYPKLKKVNEYKDIDDQIIASASDMSVDHYDYQKISVYLLIRDLHDTTSENYLDVAKELKNNNDKHGKNNPIISPAFFDFVEKNYPSINSALDYSKDYDVPLFGYRTLEKAYLKKNCDGKIIERPQHLFMRVAISLHFRAPYGSTDMIISKILETYNLLSGKYFTHATPTLFNSGTNYEQDSSCFLLGIEDDMEEVGECWKACAIISKYAGGIGIHVTNLRCRGAYINSTQGRASGLRIASVFNEIARYADQSGRRPGSIALYIEPWHGDILYFLDLKKNTGAETDRARDLFLGLVINDIFMHRVETDGSWSLMCPSECPDLLNKFGEEFTQIYESYESAGKFMSQMNARDLWFKILESQIETGVPYILFKDATNKKTNQANIGVINGSNLCVAGDTKILTSGGYHEIKNLMNETVRIWNGIEFSEVTVKNTGKNQKVIHVKFSNGSYVKCTPYHKFYIQKDDNEVIIKRASELDIGDQLVPTEYPVITEPEFRLVDTKGDDVQAFGLQPINTILAGIQDIPINKNLDTKIEYLKKIITKEKPHIHSDNFTYLTNIKYMMQTMGCDPHITTSSYGWFVLTLSGADTNQLIKLGLNFYSVSDPTKKPIVIESIQNTVFTEDTYCFNEPNRHTGIFNGIIAGNCIEIAEVSTSEEYAVCNLASICLPKFIDNGEYNYQKLCQVTRIITRNLNNIIDINFYPTEKAKKSNLRHRPIGIGVQGLADVFMIFKIPFESEQAKDLNKKIFETIYYGCMLESAELAEQYGPYDTFVSSPISKGKFQFNLWGLSESELSGMWDWSSLRTKIMRSGVRNSLTTACMPTASTSQIMGFNECIEAFTSNIYTRSTIAGDFYVINKYLMDDLINLGLWNSDMVDLIKYYEGSVQHIDDIPDYIKKIYKTVWEIEQKHVIEMAADRGPFIDQTQSMNIHMARDKFCAADHWSNQPMNARLTSSHFLAWKLGLKTGIYYLRTKPASEPNQFGIDIDKINGLENKYKLANILTEETSTRRNITTGTKSNSNPQSMCKTEICMMCSS